MQNKNKKVLSVCAMASLLITSSAAAINVKADTVTPPESPRLWGSDRYETALKVSQAGWTGGSDYAVIASGEGYADALCAAPLAKVNNAPILLTQKNSISPNTIAELKRLNVKHVYIIGGQGVVSQAVEEQIKSQVASDIQRLWGQNRYETSVKVAEKLGKTSKVVLASGEGYADALSAAPVAAIEGMPVLLTQSSTLSQPTADYIKGHSEITKTYVIGGYASVSDATKNVVPGAERLSGANRYETNSAVVNAFASDFSFNNAYVALAEGPTGNEFADALTGSAIAAKNKNPLIITAKELNVSTAALMKSKLTSTSTITVLGGIGNVSDGLIASMRAAIAQGSTVISGGGGGGTSVGYGINLTKVVSEKILNKVTDKLASNPSLKSYFWIDPSNKNVIQSKYASIDMSKNPILVTAKDSDYKSLKSIFSKVDDKGQSTDVETVKSKLDKVQEAMDTNSQIMGDILIDGKSYNEFLGSLDSTYFTEQGKLKSEEIAKRICGNTLTYEKFNDDLKKKINDKYGNAKGPEITVNTSLGDETVVTISKGTTKIYDKNQSIEKNADDLLKFLGDNAASTYTIQAKDKDLGNVYFKVQYK